MTRIKKRFYIYAVVCRDKAGATVSHILARYGHTEALRWLVETRGDECVIVRTLRGATPLHYAATSGHLDTIRLIVQRLYVLSRASTSRIHCSLSGHVTSASSCSRAYATACRMQDRSASEMLPNVHVVRWSNLPASFAELSVHDRQSRHKGDIGHFLPQAYI